ncbi:hypothetical protein LWI28_003752 [Acer negundo]|uniref:Uncharacterized protein n=1 Tax=Acer negundo TaxID=4023 RepID=A0AAD5ISI7_ACENE|nr:hypothetical protein LWI28_003752 [Acer negundo]
MLQITMKCREDGSFLHLKLDGFRLYVCRILVAVPEEVEFLDLVLVEYAKESFSVKVHEDGEVSPEWIWDKLGLPLLDGHPNKGISPLPVTVSLQVKETASRKLVSFGKDGRERGCDMAHREVEDTIDGVEWSG